MLKPEEMKELLRAMQGSPEEMRKAMDKYGVRVFVAGQPYYEDGYQGKRVAATSERTTPPQPKVNTAMKQGLQRFLANSFEVLNQVEAEFNALTRDKALAARMTRAMYDLPDMDNPNDMANILDMGHKIYTMKSSVNSIMENLRIMLMFYDFPHDELVVKAGQLKLRLDSVDAGLAAKVNGLIALTMNPEDEECPCCGCPCCNCEDPCCSSCDEDCNEEVPYDPCEGCNDCDGCGC